MTHQEVLRALTAFSLYREKFHAYYLKNLRYVNGDRYNPVVMDGAPFYMKGHKYVKCWKLFGTGIAYLPLSNLKREESNYVMTNLWN